MELSSRLPGQLFVRLSMLLLAVSLLLSQASAARAADNIIKATSEPAPAQNLIYAVDNAGGGKSQLYTINPSGFAVAALGPQAKHDFEDVAISISNHLLFASTGSDIANDKGRIYRVDGITGALTLVGASGFDRITIMKFRASDDTLWGWAEGKGLVQLNQATGKGSLVFASTKKFEGMAFQPDGKLYLAIDTKLYVLDLAAKTLKKFASNLPSGTESLATRSNGQLLGGISPKSKPALFTYDIATKRVVSAKLLASPFKSIKGLCVPSGLIF